MLPPGLPPPLPLLSHDQSLRHTQHSASQHTLTGKGKVLRLRLSDCPASCSRQRRKLLWIKTLIRSFFNCLLFLYHYCNNLLREREQNYCFVIVIIIIITPNVATVCCRRTRDFFFFLLKLFLHKKKNILHLNLTLL